jgi:hypothetical protein
VIDIVYNKNNKAVTLTAFELSVNIGALFMVTSVSVLLQLLFM